ncbi:hypothetical protein [Enterobacter ludwigii]|uniref:hypothetical protein n=1 Tax=Enterobacter ludwigii TaxID=299767 RepID=UPI003974DE22
MNDSKMKYPAKDGDNINKEPLCLYEESILGELCEDIIVCIDCRLKAGDGSLECFLHCHKIQNRNND